MSANATEVPPRPFRLLAAEPALRIPMRLEATVADVVDCHEGPVARLALDLFTLEDRASLALGRIVALLPGAWVYRGEARWVHPCVELVDEDARARFLPCAQAWVQLVAALRRFNATQFETHDDAPQLAAVAAERRAPVEVALATYLATLGALQEFAAARHAALQTTPGGDEAWLDFLRHNLTYRTPTFETMWQPDGHLKGPDMALGAFRRSLYAAEQWNCPRRLIARSGVTSQHRHTIGSTITHLDGTQEIRLHSLPLDGRVEVIDE